MEEEVQRQFIFMATARESAQLSQAQVARVNSVLAETFCGGAALKAISFFDSDGAEARHFTFYANLLKRDHFPIDAEIFLTQCGLNPSDWMLAEPLP